MIGSEHEQVDRSVPGRGGRSAASWNSCLKLSRPVEVGGGGQALPVHERDDEHREQRPDGEDHVPDHGRQRHGQQGASRGWRPRRASAGSPARPRLQVQRRCSRLSCRHAPIRASTTDPAVSGPSSVLSRSGVSPGTRPSSFLQRSAPVVPLAARGTPSRRAGSPISAGQVASPAAAGSRRLCRPGRRALDHERRSSTSAPETTSGLASRIWVASLTQLLSTSVRVHVAS